MYIVPFVLSLLSAAFCSTIDGQFIIHPNAVTEFNLKEINSSLSLMLCLSDDEKYAFITSGQAGVHIIDLSDTINPKILSIIKSKYAKHCEVKNNILFIADLEEGLVIVDVKDKRNPKRIVAVINDSELMPS